ncbi:MAG: class I SAM-dependent methyltransferase [Lentisphaeraceae bacterium]|nr:class I SAM-dependent methyltransferase [Lentisphaeraceae bacterium]
MDVMNQNDLKLFFEDCWSKRNTCSSEDKLCYSSPIEDKVLYPAYKELLNTINLNPNGADILDIGCGSGRWIRYFKENFTPKSLTGLDLADSSIKLLNKWYKEEDSISFQVEDICNSDLNLNKEFDLINIANVFFHVVEQELFVNGMQNIKKHLAPGGYAITTEYLPNVTTRTPMMLVHNREDYQRVVDYCGLKIVDIKAFAFFCNDPMGLDPTDKEARSYFNKARTGIQQILDRTTNPEEYEKTIDVFSLMEKALSKYLEPRIKQIDYPSQKLVVLTHADE